MSFIQMFNMPFYRDVFKKLDKVFPEFDWQKHPHGYWFATELPPGFHFPGVVLKDPMLLKVYANNPHMIKIHPRKGDWMPFTDYLLGCRQPETQEELAAAEEEIRYRVSRLSKGNGGLA